MSLLQQYGLFYALVVARTLAMFSAMPMLKSEHVPKIWKILLGCGFGLIMGSWLIPTPVVCAPPLVVFHLIWEMVVGFTLGFVVQLAVGAAVTAGTLLDFQVGYANSGLLNPGGDKPEPLTASFYQVLLLLLALKLNFHLLLVQLLAGSFERFPVGAVVEGLPHLLEVGQQAFAGFFSAALWLALPISVSLLTAEIAIAFLSRLMPQMNMLIAAAPLRVMAGLVIISAALPITLGGMSRLLDWSFELAGGLSV